MITRELENELTSLAYDFDKKGILFYDVECYKHDSFVVIKNIHKETVAYFHVKTGFNGLTEILENYLMVGYNNYHYDDYIITKMVENIEGKDNFEIKRVNDEIMSGGTDTQICSYLRSLDCFQQINVSMPSLKKIEANKGVSIEETQIGFDIDRELTEEELQREIEYCSHDVNQTIDVFIDRWSSYFKPKMYVLKLLTKEDGSNKKFMYSSAYRWNTTTLATNVVKDDYKTINKQYYLDLPDEIGSLVSPDIVEMWNTKEKGKIVQEHFNNKFEFGFGGLHSVHQYQKDFTNVIGADFESLYPNIMINFNLLGKYTDRFKEIVDRRLFAKAEMKRLKEIENPTDEELTQLQAYDDEQGALKLVINSIYGLLKNKYSQLFNPKVSTLVCAIGQCYLFELTKRLSSCAKIVQTNTDGVYFVPSDDRWKSICDSFAEEVNINLDYSEYKRFIQKDVNNYIAITHKDKLYLKGGDTNQYFGPKVYQTATSRICQIALVDKLAYDKDVLETILERRNEPVLYQYILQAGSTYKGTYDTEGNEYQKVNRVFASKLKNHVSLKKVRQDGGMVSYANAPDKMFVWNKSVDELGAFDQIVDVNHYYQITQRMLELWQK